MVRFCALTLAAFFTVSLTAFAQDKKGPLAELPSMSVQKMRQI
jgi:hypothetical protein